MPADTPQHPVFPLQRFLGFLRTAQDITILDTRLFLLDDEYRAAFVTGLTSALDRGARATIVLVCPCSEGMRRHARELGKPYEAVKKAADTTIVTLDRLCQALDVGADRLSVWLTPVLPTHTSYRCDGRIFSATVTPNGPAHLEPHFEYSIESPHGQLTQSTLKQATLSGMRLERYMRGELKAITDTGVLKIDDLRYLEHDTKLFLIMADPRHILAADQSQGGSWRHGKHAWRGFTSLQRVEPAAEPDMHSLLTTLAHSKYGETLTADPAGRGFYQVVR
jgi:hypothetical protein